MQRSTRGSVPVQSSASVTPSVCAKPRYVTFLPKESASPTSSGVTAAASAAGESTSGNAARESLVNCCGRSTSADASTASLGDAPIAVEESVAPMASADAAERMFHFMCSSWFNDETVVRGSFARRNARRREPARLMRRVETNSRRACRARERTFRGSAEFPALAIRALQQRIGIRHVADLHARAVVVDLLARIQRDHAEEHDLVELRGVLERARRLLRAANRIDPVHLVAGLDAFVGFLGLAGRIVQRFRQQARIES